MLIKSVRVNPSLLEQVKRALEAEGFKDPLLFQIYEEGQVFGLAKDLDDIWRIHVRGFGDGHLKAEIEPQPWFIEHLDSSTSRPAYQELCEILNKHGIVYSCTYSLTEGKRTWKLPQQLTDWRPLAIIGAFLVIFIGALTWLNRKGM